MPRTRYFKAKKTTNVIESTKKIPAKTSENERYGCKNRKKPLKSKTAQPSFSETCKKRRK